MLYNFFSDNFEYDECVSKGSCSIPPSISALQEVIVICLRQLAYYILQLENFGQDCSVESNIIIEALSTVISSTDYNDEQLLNMVSKVYYHVITSRQRYINLCGENNVTSKELKSSLIITPQMNLSQIMSLGEKAFLTKYKKTPRLQKNMADILLAVAKSVAVNVAKLMDYSCEVKEYVRKILTALELLNHSRASLEKLKNNIKTLAELDKKLIGELATAQNKYFGAVCLSEVSLSTTKGKAILVSGESLLDLNNVLEAVKGKDIDVYTHDELIVAHTFEKFKSYENLKGHYGTCSGNCVFDFATFPGAILLTRNSNVNTEYLYRGRLFTTSSVLPKGVVPVKNQDYSALIKSAENAKGFAKGREFPAEVVGYDADEFDELCKNLSSKFSSGEIERLIIVGPTIQTYTQDGYFEKLMKLAGKKDYVISFSYSLPKDNCTYINLASSLPMIYPLLNKLFKNIPIDSEKIAFFITKCDVTALSHMIALKNLGVKNIFFSNCQPKINPSITSTLSSIYGIKLISIPEDDINFVP